MNWRKLLYLPMALALLLLLAGCGNSGTETAAPDSAPEALENTTQTPETVAVPEEEESGGTPDSGDADETDADSVPEEIPVSEETSSALVVYFSRIGEQYSVGVIEQGNTAIVAEMIAERTGADVFEITPAEDHYPTDNYRALTEVGLQEQDRKNHGQIQQFLPIHKITSIFPVIPV